MSEFKMNEEVGSGEVDISKQEPQVNLNKENSGNIGQPNSGNIGQPNTGNMGNQPNMMNNMGNMGYGQPNMMNNMWYSQPNMGNQQNMMNNQYYAMYGHPNNPYNQCQYQNNVPYDKAAADKLCWISLILLIVGKVAGVLSGFGISLLEETEASHIFGFIASLTGGANIASLVLMIVVRVKYPQSTFGKVLMWIHIALIIISIILGIALLFSFALCVSDCLHQCGG